MAAESARIFRLSRATYIAVFFIACGVTVFVRSVPLIALYVIPVVAWIYIVRLATIVGRDGILVRSLIGERAMPWSEIRGLNVTGRNVYAVITDGAVRLPCVRLADLAAVSAASYDHIPPLPEATPKFAPQRRHR